VNADRSITQVAINRFDGTTLVTKPDMLAVEEPLEIRLGFGPESARIIKSISVTMRTPGHDAELAVGFLVTEGVVRDEDDIVSVTVQIPVETDVPLTPADVTRGNLVTVELSPNVAVNTAVLERNFYMTSSCGICGKASLLALRTVCPPRRENQFTIDARTLTALPGSLRAMQGIFDRTGGLHAAALFDSAGTLQAMREDVGRHNAVDKLLGGACLAGQVPLRDRVLLLSGRASFELLQKALMTGIPMVAAVGAPSSLAVRVAQEFDITLIGFLRDNHFNVYHGAERVIAGDPKKKDIATP
jgi:FdhD protein